MPDIDFAQLRELYIKTNGTTWKYEGRDADETYLVAAANALPAIMDECERLREMNTTMISACKNPVNRTAHTQLQMCRFLDDMCNALKGGQK